MESKVLATALLSGALLALASSPGLVAQDNEKRGFDAESVYDVGEIDTVSLFNGGLSIVIPIGNEYPVNGRVSYGLSLVYNSKLWDYRTIQRLPSGNFERVAIPTKHANAGFGWSLNPGFLLSPDPASEILHEQSHWQYVGPDGSRHYFYQTLHQGESDGDTDVLYSRDNTYLRLNLTAEPYTVEFPNGEIHEFGYEEAGPPGRWTKWYLTRMKDVFQIEPPGADGNRVDISYGVKGSTWVWTISDSHARSHTVTLTYFSDIDDYYVTEVDLAAFAGARAIYTLAYSADEIEAGCGADFPETMHDVRFLTSVSLPEGATYDMTEAGAPRYLTFCGGSGESGALEGIRLPTRGQIEWTYAIFDMPLFNDFLGPNPEPATETRGVRIRRTLDADGNTIGTWQYRRELYPPQPWVTDGDPRPTELRTHVEDPDGFCTKHYFDANPRYSTPPSSSGPDPGAFYGLPLSWDEPTSNGRQLSTQVYDGQDEFGLCSGNLIRSTYVTYEHDVLPGAPSTPAGPILEGLHDTNRRLQATRTLYHDDLVGGTTPRFAETVFSDFDGLGHYRTSTTSGNFDAGNARITTTNFNPNAGTYPGSFTHPSVGSPWVLGTFDEREVTEGTEINRETFCFDALGFMTRRRSFEDDSAPIGEKAVDVVSEFQRNGVGNLRFERYYGGDVQAMDTGTDLCTISLSSPQYELEHQYMFGAREFTRYLDPGPGGNLKLFEHVIDPSTGLVASTDDPAGITIDYTYDTLGRRTREQPEPGHGARVDLIYTNAAAPSAKAQLDIVRSPNGGGTALAQDRTVFDDLGRVFEEQRLLPSGSFNVRRTLYNARGLRESISETEGGSPIHFTASGEYDAFGRPGRITPPDGSAHDVVLEYKGVSQVSRKVMIYRGESEGASGESLSTTTEIFDRQGRLHQVVEPSGSSGAPGTTTYEYDAGNRLAKVSMTDGATTQERFFTYDGRGFLESEQHPEKGTSGNGTVLYKNYDARGHAGRKEDGASPSKNDLRFTYDGKERLTEVKEFGGAQRALKEFEYGTSGLANGKLFSATRHNYLAEFANNDLRIREIYTYGGVGGRISKRQTERTDIAPGGGILQGPAVWFETDFTWTELGDLSSVTYPTCLIPAECTGVPDSSGQPSRTVNHLYTNGFLASIPGFATALTYHPNEMLATVVHANGVTDQHDLDPNSMRRPAAIRTTGVFGLGDFDSGSYLYDGAGNVKAIGADTFGYDGVSRLVYGTSKATETDIGFVETSAYDVFGNRIAASTAPVGSRAIEVDPTTNRLLPPPLELVEERDIVYDSRGNQTQWGSAFYTFDAFDQMVLHQDADPGLDASFVYTADDERIITINNPTPSETWYLRDLDGQILRKFLRLVGDTDWQRDTIRRQGQVLATDTVGLGVHHAHIDHLGTIRLWTQPDTMVFSRHDYTAFGEEVIDTLDGQDQRYTGHERDIARSGGCSGTTTVDNQTISSGQTFTGCDVLSSTNTTVTSVDEVRFKAGDSIALDEFTVADGATFVVELDGGLNSDLQDLDYMHARHCSPVTGRFLSVDPIGGNPRSPQSWNRYGYVLGNPLKYTDPFGLVACGVNEELDCKGVVDDEITVTEDFLPVRLTIAPPRRFTAEFGGVSVVPFRDRNVEILGAVVQSTGAIAAGAEGLQGLFLPTKEVDSIGDIAKELGVHLALAALPPGRFAKFGNKPARDLISARLKRSKSYREELAHHTLQKLDRLSKGKGAVAEGAKAMKKLILQSPRLGPKTRTKPR